MKKVLLVLPSDFVSGAEQYLMEMGKHLIGLGFHLEVVFLTASWTGDWEASFDAANRTFIFLPTTSEHYGFFKLIRWIDQNQETYEYVLTSQIQLNALIALKRKKGKLKAKHHIARESTFIFNRFSGLSLMLRYKSFYWLGYRHIELLITQSTQMADELRQNLSPSVWPKKIVTIPNLIDLVKVKKKGEEFTPEYSDYVVTAGRFIPEKGFDLLIHAFGRLPNKNLKLLILGDGIQTELLKTQVADLSLQDRVVFTGRVDNPMPYFKHARLCVVSSRVEGFPNVLLQMMALNECIVSTLCAGGIDLLDGVLTCRASDEDALLDAIQKRLSITMSNRGRFDEQLETRTVEAYWNKILDHLHA